MSFDKEWAQLRTESAQRQEAHTQINHLDDGTGGRGAPPSSGSTTPDLSVKSDELGAIGHDAFLLHDRIMSDGGWAELTTLQASLDLRHSNLGIGAALATADEVWQTKLGTLQEACAYISNHLDFSAKAHAKDDADIAHSLLGVEGERLTLSKINKYFH